MDSDSGFVPIPPNVASFTIPFAAVKESPERLQPSATGLVYANPDGTTTKLQGFRGLVKAHLTATAFYQGSDGVKKNGRRPVPHALHTSVILEAVGHGHFTLSLGDGTVQSGYLLALDSHETYMTMSVARNRRDLTAILLELRRDRLAPCDSYDFDLGIVELSCEAMARICTVIHNTARRRYAKSVRSLRLRFGAVINGALFQTRDSALDSLTNCGLFSVRTFKALGFTKNPVTAFVPRSIRRAFFRAVLDAGTSRVRMDVALRNRLLTAEELENLYHRNPRVRHLRSLNHHDYSDPETRRHAVFNSRSFACMFKLSWHAISL